MKHILATLTAAGLESADDSVVSDAVIEKLEEAVEEVKEQTEEIAKEVTEISDEVDSVSEAVEELQEDVEAALESISQGDVSKAYFALINRNFDRTYSRLKLKRPAMGGLESNDGNLSRTLKDGLEGIGAQISAMVKAAIEWVKTMLSKAKAWVSKFLDRAEGAKKLAEALKAKAGDYKGEGEFTPAGVATLAVDGKFTPDVVKSGLGKVESTLGAITGELEQCASVLFAGIISQASELKAHKKIDDDKLAGVMAGARAKIKHEAKGLPGGCEITPNRTENPGYDVKRGGNTAASKIKALSSSDVTGITSAVIALCGAIQKKAKVAETILAEQTKAIESLPTSFEGDDANGLRAGVNQLIKTSRKSLTASLFTITGYATDVADAANAYVKSGKSGKSDAAKETGEPGKLPAPAAAA